MAQSGDAFRLYDDLLAPVVAVDREASVVYFNSTFAAFVQLPPRKIRGKPLGDVIRTEENATGKFLEECMTSNGPVVSPEIAIDSGQDKKEVVLKFFPGPSSEDVIITIQDFSIERVLHEKHRIQLDELKAKNAEIKKYSEGLEELVEERTRELRESKEQTESILRSIREGIFVVEKDQTIGLQCSGAAQEMLCISSLHGLSAIDTLFPDVERTGGEEHKEKFHNFLRSAFRLLIPEQFEDLTRHLPKNIKFPEAGEGKLRTFSLSFSPVVDQGDILRVVVALRDDTELEDLRNLAALVHRRVAEVLDLIRRHKEDRGVAGSFQVFLGTSSEMIAEVMRDLSALNEKTKLDTNAIFRNLHTIKGGARQFGLDFLQHFAHEAENLLDKLRGGKRLSRQERGELTELTGSLEMGIGALSALAGTSPTSTSDSDPEGTWRAFVGSLDQTVQGLGQDLGKPVQFFFESSHVLHGEDLRIFQSIALHMLRNSVDHGIEEPALRESRGKQALASVFIRVMRDGGEYVAEFYDDGGGIDAPALFAKARERGLEVPEIQDSQAAILEILTNPGFSTRDQASEISGRGVGLDAVKDTLERAGGTIRLEVTSHKGTKFSLRWLAKEADALPDMQNQPAA